MELPDNRTLALFAVFSVAALAVGLGLDFSYPGVMVAPHYYKKGFRAVSFFGLGMTQFTLLAVMLGIAMVIKHTSGQRLKDAAMAGFLALATGGITVQAVKHLVGRPRPRVGAMWEFAGPGFMPNMDSLPSGHTTTSFAIAFALGWYFPGIRWLLFVAAALISVSRVALGSHYPLDLAAGMVLGITMGYVSVRLAQKIKAGMAKKTTRAANG